MKKTKPDIQADADVMVCGGGLGGVAAAIAAARSGARTLLIERNTYLGGVATAGMCCSIFNCYFTGGSNRRLATGGIAVEVADRLAQAEGYGDTWRKHKGHIIYDIENGKRVLQEMVLEAGAKILLHSWVSDIQMEGNLLQGVVVQGKSGKSMIQARTVVDATGDADIAALAGAPLHRADNGQHSLCFRLGGVDVDRFVRHFREHPEEYPAYMDVDWSIEEALAQYDECGTFLFPHGGGIQLTAFQRAKADQALPARIGLQDTTDACQMHAIRRTGMVHVVTGFTRFNGLDAGMITDSILDGRRMAFVLANVFRKYLPGFQSSFVAGTADNLGVRWSRWIDGDFVFTSAMMNAGNRMPDAVGRTVGWDDTVKHCGANAWGAQVCRDDSFDLPYRCLLPRCVEGLLMGAGRSVSAKEPALLQLRVMVHTMVVGQAAGTAAAVAAKTGTTPRGVDVSAVQAELRRQGVAIV